MTLGAISCERRLRINVAVSFPFSNLVPRVLSVGENSGNEVVRFQEFVRRERVSKTAVFIWLVNLLFTCLQWANCNHIFKGIHLCLWLASLVIAFSAQCKILLISLRHERQIKRHNLGTSSQRQMQSKLAINLTSIVAIYLPWIYLPFLSPNSIESFLDILKTITIIVGPKLWLY